MMLRQAPVIVRCFANPGDWLSLAQRRCRAQFLQQEAQPAPPGGLALSNRLRQLDQDIWAMRGPVDMHVDKTKRYHRVLGLVLINEGNLKLVQGECVYDLPVGTLYHIDGRTSHGALSYNYHNPEALFGFMAWDIPGKLPLDELVDSIPEAMLAYGLGEERIKVA